jgi:Domain of unknown function (DUF4407)
MNLSKFLLAVLTALGVWLQRFPGLLIWCHRLCGIDRRILARAPKSEQAAYTALGALMILSASWTGLGMAYKLGESLNLSWLLRPLIFVFFMALSLCLEVAILATVKPGIGVGFIVLRVKLGLMLVVMQVTPIAVVINGGAIEAFLHRERLVAVAQAGELSAKARNVASLEQGARTLDEKAEAARAAMADPQHPPQTVVQAAAAASTAEGQLTRAQATADAARRRHAEARAAVAALASQNKLTEPERSRREAALNATLATAARRRPSRRSAQPKSRWSPPAANTRRPWPAGIVRWKRPAPLRRSGPHPRPRRWRPRERSKSMTPARPKPWRARPSSRPSAPRWARWRGWRSATSPWRFHCFSCS